jgi:hypothetical protein
MGMRRIVLLLASMALAVIFGSGVALADTVIDTMSQANGSLCCLGSDIATYGQVITAPADDTQLDSFTFLMNTGTVVMRGEVYAWDGEKATGPNLYESEPRTVTTTSGFEEVTFDTDGVQLVPGQQYVLFATMSKDYESSANSGAFATWLGVFSGSGDAYPGGSYVLMNSGSSFDQLLTSAWTSSPYLDWDLAFKAVFSTSDSPTTKEDCKKGGYAEFDFASQEECMAFVRARA